MLTPQDTNLTFYVNVYYDLDLLQICLEQLRNVYRHARLILRSDGDPNPEIATVAQKYGAECHYDKHLMGLESGGEIVDKMLQLFLVAPTPYLFKIDPDTQIAHRFNTLPQQECVFGTLQRQGELFSIQGGCIGFTLDAARKFYTSGFFRDPALKECPPPWVITEPLAHRPIQLGLTSIDWTVGWACRKLNVPLVDWPEIMSEWQVVPDNDDLRYAVTHPHKQTPPNPDAIRCALRYWANVVSMTGHTGELFQEHNDLHSS